MWSLSASGLSLPDRPTGSVPACVQPTAWSWWRLGALDFSCRPTQTLLWEVVT